VRVHATAQLKVQHFRSTSTTHHEPQRPEENPRPSPASFSRSRRSHPRDATAREETRTNCRPQGLQTCRHFSKQLPLDQFSSATTSSTSISTLLACATPTIKPIRFATDADGTRNERESSCFREQSEQSERAECVVEAAGFISESTGPSADFPEFLSALE